VAIEPVPQTSSRVLSDEERRNRDVAVEFLDRLCNQPGGVDRAIELLGDDYRQHNPDVEDGPAGVHAFVTRIREANPNIRAEFKRVLVDGEFVVIHGHARVNDTDPELATIDIFRVRDGLLREHWDVGQAIPAESRNANGMF
jgi:predicted SnoaL-like aldol condensation-catalyzing enzyme